MSADSDLIKLYSDRILALAADMSATTPLQDPHISVKKRSPLCGSVVTVDIKVKAGRVTDYAQDVKACALGQAAASVVGRSIIGCDRAQIEKARNALQAMLTSNGPTPDAPFDGLEVLLPAKDYKNRHASILLALEAASEAMQKAAHQDCA